MLSRAVVESAGNEIRSMVSLPLPGSSSLHKYLDQFLVTMIDDCDLFVLYKQFPSGGTIWRMLGFDETGADYEDILAVADCLAESGHEVKILHAVHGQIQNGVPILGIWIFDGKKVKVIYNTEG